MAFQQVELRVALVVLGYLDAALVALDYLDLDPSQLGIRAMAPCGEVCIVPRKWQRPISHRPCYVGAELVVSLDNAIDGDPDAPDVGCTCSHRFDGGVKVELRRLSRSQS